MDETHLIERVDPAKLQRSLGWLQAIGVGLALLGFTAAYAPFWTSFSIDNIIGGLYVAAGAMFIAHTLRSVIKESFFAERIFGLLYLGAGILLLAHPLETVLALTLFAGICQVSKGALEMMFSTRLNTVKNRQWLVLGGLISILTGIAILAGLAALAPWAVSVLVGMDLVFSGLSVFALSHAARESATEGRVFCIGDACPVR